MVEKETRKKDMVEESSESMTAYSMDSFLLCSFYLRNKVALPQLPVTGKIWRSA